jgi:hypothetical protein
VSSPFLGETVTRLIAPLHSTQVSPCPYVGVRGNEKIDPRLRIWTRKRAHYDVIKGVRVIMSAASPTVAWVEVPRRDWAFSPDDRHRAVIILFPTCRRRTSSSGQHSFWACGECEKRPWAENAIEAIATKEGLRTLNVRAEVSENVGVAVSIAETGKPRESIRSSARYSMVLRADTTSSPAPA